jgi:hypothetical protein
MFGRLKSVVHIISSVVAARNARHLRRQRYAEQFHLRLRNDDGQDRPGTLAH